MLNPCPQQPQIDPPGSPVGSLRGRTPAQVIAAWPGTSPLAALTSGSIPGPHARWTILASPTSSLTGYRNSIRGALGSIPAPALSNPAPGSPPFTGGWIGWIGYEAGASIEPAAQTNGALVSGRDWPDACFLRCPGAMVHDARVDRWSIVGDARSLPALDFASDDRAYKIGPLSSLTGRDRYTRDAASIIGLIHAGDAFQVNLAHHLTAPFRGDARRCFLDLTRSVSPWFGAYIERPDGLGAVCSLSPELFLRADLVGRTVTTRPIKGTRPDTSDEAELRGSAKDAAELAMIVDLMRNDLGRVCTFGSVRVTDAQSIERHAAGPGDQPSAGVLHGVATITGRLREGVDLGALLDASFPPGSVTGAPKVRAMQIIDEFESIPRGPYCGAIGFVSYSGPVELSVAIRTASILGRRLDPDRLGAIEGTLSFPVGAGLVADSDPQAEWLETLDKAAAFVAALRRTNS